MSEAEASRLRLAAFHLHEPQVKLIRSAVEAAEARPRERVNFDPGRREREINFRLGADYDERVARLARRDGVTASYALRMAINDYVSGVLEAQRVAG